MNNIFDVFLKNAKISEIQENKKIPRVIISLTSWYDWCQRSSYLQLFGSLDD